MIATEDELGMSGDVVPAVGVGITRAEAECVSDVLFGFFGAPKEDLRPADCGMRWCQVVFEHDRPFRLSDAEGRPVGAYVDPSQGRVRPGAIGRKRKGLSCSSLGRR